jgi:hypothetical protein
MKSPPRKISLIKRAFPTTPKAYPNSPLKKLDFFFNLEKLFNIQ